MKHLFIPYELAKLAKEKGFNEPCMYAYCEQGGWNKYSRSREPIIFVLKTDGNPFGQFFQGKNWNRVIEPNTKSKVHCSAPLYQQIIDWLDSKGLHIDITPEFYRDGINWNWQIFWYLPKEKQTIDKFYGGTAMYGDNNEYPTRIEAVNKAIEEALKLIP